MDLDYLMDEIVPDDTEVVLKKNQVYNDIILSVEEIAKGKIAYNHDTSVFTVCNISFTIEDVYALTMYCDESIEVILRS